MPAAHALIQSANLDADNIQRLIVLLDEAWASVQLRPQDHGETLRLVLAEALIDLSAAGQTDPEKLKELALLRLRQYRGI